MKGVQESVEDRGGEDVVAQDAAPLANDLFEVMIIEPRS